jgi:N4-gp56 family major capsid protein
VSTTTTGTLPYTIKEYWDKRLLLRALPNLQHNRWGQPGVIPSNMGDVYEWRKFGALDTITSSLPEGITPAPHTPDMTRVRMTADWYGAYIAHSDRLQYTAYDPIISEFSELLGEQCGRSIDILTRTQMVSGFTTVVRPGTYTADSDITSTDVMTYALLVKAMATLAGNDALPAEGMDYVAILHPYVWADLLNDEDIHKVFQAAADSESINPFRTGYLGKILNIKLYMTTHGYVNSDAGSGNVDVYTTFLLARQAYGVGGISGFTPRNVDSSEGKPGGLTGQSVKPVEIIVKELGSGGSLDPLNQRATAAWKASHTSATLNASFAVAIRTAASMGANT